MSKVMLVEDDNNLREIYEARLKAEGYDIISAKDGEEALVIAKAEKPQLIISDVMMPKISGFEMLDILRNTEGLKEVKVIMLTALGQSDDQLRADKLGADRYLVKSQVTLEDIVKVTHELLQDQGAPAAATPAPATTPIDSSNPTPTAAPVTPTPIASDIPVVTPPPVTSDPIATTPVTVTPPATSVATTPAPTVPAVTPVAPAPIPPPAPEPTPIPEPAAPAPTPSEPATPVAPVADSMAASSAQEEADVEAKIEDFVAGATTDPTPPSIPTPKPAAPEEPKASPEEIAANALKDDALMSKAVDTLISDTKTPPDEATSKTDTPVVIPTSAPEAPESEAPEPAKDEETTIITPSASATLPATDTEDLASTGAEPESGSGNVTIANKKVIKPIIDDSPKKDIQTLLALEEAQQAAKAPPPPPTVLIDNGQGVQAAPLAEAPAPAAATEFATAKQAEESKKDEDKPAAPPDPNAVAL